MKVEILGKSGKTRGESHEYTCTEESPKEIADECFMHLQSYNYIQPHGYSHNYDRHCFDKSETPHQNTSHSTIVWSILLRLLQKNATNAEVFSLYKGPSYTLYRNSTNGIVSLSEDVAFIIPIFQQYKTWKPNEVYNLVKKIIKKTVGMEEAELDTLASMFMGERRSVSLSSIGDFDKPVNDKYQYVSKPPPQHGPAMKLPNGEVVTSCCSACTHSVSNMSGLCSFGTKECLSMCEFGTKSKLLENLKKYVQAADNVLENGLPSLLHGTMSDENGDLPTPEICASDDEEIL
jgi:hypothetical protein